MGASITDPIASEPGIDWTVYGWDYAPLTEALAWEAGLTAAAEHASGRAPDLVKILVDGEFRDDPRDWPGGAGFRASDEASGGTSGADASSDARGGGWSTETPSDWFARTAPNNEAVLFYSRGLQLNHRELFSVLLAGLAPRLAGFGLPKGDVEGELFFGRYSATPGGIHREGCSNLHLVLRGSKAMHMWRGEDWIPEGTARRIDEEPMAGVLENYLPDLDPGEVMAAATSLRAVGGQGFFWRSGTWHVGEAIEPSLAVNIASYTGSFEDTSTGLPLPLGKDGEVPREWLSDYRSYAGIKDDDTQILARASAVGMRGAGPRPTEVTETPWVVLRSPAPVLWFRDGERLQVATHGQSAEFAVGVSDWLTELIERGPGSGLSVAVPPEAAACARWLSVQGMLDAGEPC